MRVRGREFFTPGARRGAREPVSREVVNPSISSVSRRLASVALCALTLLLQHAACAAEPSEIQAQRDIPYKSGSLDEYETTRCKLDVFAPAEAKDLPCVVWFHGGGLTGGNKGGALGPALAERGNGGGAWSITG